MTLLSKHCILFAVATISQLDDALFQEVYSLFFRQVPDIDAFGSHTIGGSTIIF